MNLKKNIRSITFLKSNAADLLEQINTSHAPVIITQNGEARAVIQDPESYERTRTALGLLKLIAQGEQDVRDGKTADHKVVMKRIGKILNRFNK